MTITIDDTKLNGLNAIIAKQEVKEGEIPVTAEKYLTDRIYEALASYDAQLIADLKKQYDDVITVAATLTPDRQQQAIAFIQQLAAGE